MGHYTRHFLHKDEGNAHGLVTVLEVHVDSLTLTVDDSDDTSKQLPSVCLLPLVFPLVVIPSSSVAGCLPVYLSPSDVV